jgi:hypothetical protein
MLFQLGHSPGPLAIIPAAPKLLFWNNEGSRRGLGLTLARLYAKHRLETNRLVLIVPAAMGETSILQWLGMIEGNGTSLHPDMKARVEYALSLPGNHRVLGWFEMQGESDIHAVRKYHSPNHALMPDDATYEARKLDLIDRVRTDFGTFPMLFGGYSDGWLARSPVKRRVWKALINAAAARDLCMTVSCSGLSDNSSIDPKARPVHYSAQAQEVLAHRFFAAYRAILE